MTKLWMMQVLPTEASPSKMTRLARSTRENVLILLISHQRTVMNDLFILNSSQYTQTNPTNIQTRINSSIAKPFLFKLSNDFRKQPNLEQRMKLESTNIYYH